MNTSRARSLLVPLTFAILAGAQATAQVRYHLFPLKGGSTAAAGISRSGLVMVGTIDAPAIGPITKLPKACCWIFGRPHVLRPINADAKGLNNAATHVNLFGTIAGSLSYGNDLSATHAVLWKLGVPRDLGTLPGHGHSMVQGLNDRNVVVGFSAPAQFYFGGNRAFRYSKGKMVELPRLQGMPEAQAFDINNRGTVVGLSGDLWNFLDPSAKPVVWRGGKASELALPKDASHGHAQAINDAGVIAGVAGVFQNPFYSGTSRPVRWDRAGRPAYLPLPTGHNTGWVSCINSRGDMVGSTGKFELYRMGDEPALWTGGKVHRLRDITTAPDGFSWDFATASQINNRGWIVGSGMMNGKPAGFLAVPVRR